LYLSISSFGSSGKHIGLIDLESISPSFYKQIFSNGELTLSIYCLYKMLPLYHLRTTSSLAPPIFYVTKKIGNKNIEGSPFPFDKKYKNCK